MNIVRVVAIATAVLIMAAGLCLLDSDHPGSEIDLCGGVLTLAVGPTVAFSLMVGWFSALPIALLQPYCSDLPYPPPRR
jgi:hypothetical protein